MTKLSGKRIRVTPEQAWRMRQYVRAQEDGPYSVHRFDDATGQQEVSRITISAGSRRNTRSGRDVPVLRERREDLLTGEVVEVDIYLRSGREVPPQNPRKEGK